MANVLNKTTKEYLISVNTPDYDKSEWLINPDLSEVLNIPSQYWVIYYTVEDVSTTIIEKQYVDDGEGGTIEIDVEVPTVIKENVGHVRPMTDEEIAEYDANNPPIPAKPTHLNDGTPAYWYEPAGESISTEKIFANFFAKVNSAKNFGVPSSEFGSIGYLVRKSAVIKSITGSVAKEIPEQIDMRIQVNGTLVYTLSLNSMFKTEELSSVIRLNAGDRITIYAACSANICDPSVQIELAWRN